MRIRMGPDNDELHLAPNFDTTQWELESNGDRVTRFTGQLLGLGSSKRPEHNHIANTPSVMSHESHGHTARCAACRWSEFYIFRVEQGDGPANAIYAVYTLGPSVVRGETTRVALHWAMSGFEVVEIAMVRRGDRGAPYLPAANARALAMAADVDERIANAYVNRAVA
jgi:hypothetical protein